MKVLLSFVLVFVFIGCCKPGNDGASIVKGEVLHHEAAIPDAVVYIKFDAKELPSIDPNDFDMSVTADANGKYEVTGLNCGNYYFFGLGIDGNLNPPNDAVKGGLRVKIENDGDVMDVDVFVTEE